LVFRITVITLLFKKIPPEEFYEIAEIYMNRVSKTAGLKAVFNTLVKNH